MIKSFTKIAQTALLERLDARLLLSTTVLPTESYWPTGIFDIAEVGKPSKGGGRSQKDDIGNTFSQAEPITLSSTGS